jgi:hypothetical protein
LDSLVTSLNLFWFAWNKADGRVLWLLEWGLGIANSIAGAGAVGNF